VGSNESEANQFLDWTGILKMRLASASISFGFIFLLCVGCAKNVYLPIQPQVNQPELKTVEMMVEVISFRRNSGHYSLPDGGSYLLHHSTLYVHSPEKYKGRQLIVRHRGDRAPPKVWTTVGGPFRVSVPIEFMADWNSENYEFYAAAFTLLTDQSGKAVSDNETPKPDQVGEAGTGSHVLVRLSVQSYRERVPFYYLNGSQVVSHISNLIVVSPEQYRGRVLVVTHPTDADPNRIWMIAGGSFEAWIRESYLDDKENRINSRAVKIATR
jgi:hypothetical protein